MTHPHVQVVVGGDSLPEGLRTALRRVGATASFRPMAEILRRGVRSTADAIVVVAPDDARSGDQRLSALFEHVAARPRATLVLRMSGKGTTRPEHPANVPVCFAGDVNEDELTFRLSTMIDMAESLKTLHREERPRPEPNQKMAQLYRQQLNLASRVQREFYPEDLPQFGPLKFSAVYRPTDYVSGDIYRVRRLDEDHVAVALADAEGHGIPAALLTVYLTRALRGRERENGAYRLLPPNEVLAQLNEELLDAELSECHFVAAVYALINLRTCEVQIARGGAPYPILRRRNGDTQFVRPEGSVIGVLPEARFSVESFRMSRGDTLMLYSDGLEPVIREPRGATRPELSSATCWRAREDAAVLGHRSLSHHGNGRSGSCVATRTPVSAAANAQRPLAAPGVHRWSQGGGGGGGGGARCTLKRPHRNWRRSRRTRCSRRQAGIASCAAMARSRRWNCSRDDTTRCAGWVATLMT